MFAKVIRREERPEKTAGQQLDKRPVVRGLIDKRHVVRQQRPVVRGSQHIDKRPVFRGLMTPRNIYQSFGV